MRFLFFLIAGFCSSALFAQLNESDTLLLQYRVALTGHIQTGNLEARALVGRLDLSVAPTDRWAIKTQNTARHQAFYGKKADNDFGSQNFVYLGQRQAVYPFAMAFLSGNYRRKIDFRWFAGPGLTWQALRRPGQVLKISLAGVYETTRFAGQLYNFPEYNGDDRIGVWRATARVNGQHRILEKKLRLSYEAYIQPAFNRSNNYRWLLDAMLEVPLWKGLNVAAHFLYTHENVVIDSVKPDDLIFTFGLTFQGN